MQDQVAFKEVPQEDRCLQSWCSHLKHVSKHHVELGSEWLAQGDGNADVGLQHILYALDDFLHGQSIDTTKQ
jgi:hypothetical protein